MIEFTKKDKKFTIEIVRTTTLEGRFLWNYAIKSEDITDLQRCNFYKKVKGTANISDLRIFLGLISDDIKK